jgi:hypothetical protein
VRFLAGHTDVVKTNSALGRRCHSCCTGNQSRGSICYCLAFVPVRKGVDRIASNHVRPEVQCSLCMLT